MKLTNDDIKYIDRWLQFSGIDYLDVRYELVDHLITEYEQLDNDMSLETFVKERLNWCKLTAKKKENTMHWGIQKAFWKRFLRFFTDLKIILPIVLCLGLLFILTEQFSDRIIRFLLLTPVFFTIGMFIYRLAFKNFGRRKQKQVLAMTKLTSLFALPQLFLTIFYMPSTWREDDPGYFMDNPYLMLPLVVLMTLMNIAAVQEYDSLYKKIKKEYQFLKASLK